MTRADRHPPPAAGPRAPPPLAIPVALAALVAVVYARVRGYGFVNLDDAAYVAENPVVLRGLSREGLAWAFDGFHVANWHPLTWLSHMLDVQLFGPEPGAHHLVNVALHATNAALLFALLRRLTGATWRSAIVAALFAVHPLHVESVAWISERKDLLSTLFLLAALGAYVSWRETGRWRAHAAALGLFALGLLAKPMVVTLPFLLLLLEVWPLARIPVAPARALGAGLLRAAVGNAGFFALSAAACAVTFLAQADGGGQSALSPIALGPRAANAIVSYVAYLGQTAWPAGLAAFYPHPATVRPGVEVLPVLGAAVLLVGVSVAVVLQRAARPYLLWGWCWYLGTLVPVIGLVQVGGQAMADRYTYVPLVGVFVAAAWGAADLVARWRLPPVAVGAASAALVAALSLASARQASYWADSLTLHRRAVAVTDGNWKAWHGLCEALLSVGQPSDAVPACRSAVEILPTFPEGWQTLGVAYARLGLLDQAIPALRRALDLRPDYFNALRNLGSAHANSGQLADAAAYFRRALALRPDDAETWAYLGLALARQGDRAGALEAHRTLRRLDPRRADALRDRIAGASASGEP